MTLDYVAIIVATIAQFVFGWIWYMPIFGKAWGEIHGFTSHSPEEQARLQKGMWKLLVSQFVFTFITSFVFVLLATYFPGDWNVFGLAGFFWLGFVLPTQVAGNMFGGAPEGSIVKKTVIQSLGSFFSLEILALVFHLMR